MYVQRRNCVTESLVMLMDFFGNFSLRVCHIFGIDVIKRMRKDARIRVIDNCGHVVLEERLAVCSKLIVEFVQLVTSGELTN